MALDLQGGDKSGPPEIQPTKTMKTNSIATLIGASALALSFTSCESKQEEAREEIHEQRAESLEAGADQTRKAGEQAADAKENQADAMRKANDRAADATENSAEATRKAAENRADQLEEKADEERDKK
jgi:hypothetical protein